MKKTQQPSEVLKITTAPNVCGVDLGTRESMGVIGFYDSLQSGNKQFVGALGPSGEFYRFTKTRGDK